MTATHRGHTITVTRSKTMAGWDALFLYIERITDRYICLEEPYYGAETVREMMAYMKSRIDNELADVNPWGQHDEQGGLDL